MNDARWHTDHDGWVWRLYDRTKHVYHASDADTENVYILPLNNEWWLIDATAAMDDDKNDWITRVTAGHGTRVAGPFTDVDHAKAAWRVIYG
jgi:hypothetical protein